MQYMCVIAVHLNDILNAYYITNLPLYSVMQHLAGLKLL